MAELVDDHMREGGILKKRERERRGSETDVPKLYTYRLQ